MGKRTVPARMAAIAPFARARSGLTTEENRDKFDRDQNQPVFESEVDAAHLRSRCACLEIFGQVLRAHGSIFDLEVGALFDFMRGHSRRSQLWQDHDAMFDDFMQAGRLDALYQFVCAECTFACRTPDVYACVSRTRM